MAKVKPKKVCKKELAGRVSRLGKLRAELSSVSAAERQLTASVKAGMEANGVDEAKGNGYVAHLATVTSLKIDPKKFRRLAGNKGFLDCVRIDVKTARSFYSDKELARAGSVSQTKKVRISPVPAAGGK